MISENTQSPAEKSSPSASTQPAQTAPSHARPWWLTAARIAVYPISMAAGYFPFMVSMRAGIYKNYAKRHYFDDLQGEESKAAEAIRKDAFENLELAQTKNIGPRNVQLNKDYRDAVATRFEKLGFKGFGTIKKFWDGLHPNQKYEAAFIYGGFAGVTLTTLLAIINNEWLLERLNEKERQQTGASLTR